MIQALSDNRRPAGRAPRSPAQCVSRVGTGRRGLAAALPLAAIAASMLAASAPAEAEDGTRRLLVTVDDLPLSAPSLHPDPELRRVITERLLATLAEHRVNAVGLVTWNNIQGPADIELLRMWLDAGHELGNHTESHLDLNRTTAQAFIADAERARGRLAGLLAERGAVPRFFRFPFLHEGDTADKVEAVRSYLSRTAQRNLPVTLDTIDWSFERPFVAARSARNEAVLREVADAYLESLRLSIRRHERTADRLFGRPVPQILLLHANEVGSATWSRLLAWLRETGHRFATADDVLSDPVFAEAADYVGAAGFGLWDRIDWSRSASQATAEVLAMLETQRGAWNRGDLEMFCSAYAEDAVFVSPSGLTRGREEVLARYRRRYPTADRMGRLSFEVIEARPLRGLETSILDDLRPGSVHAVSLVARWKLEYDESEPAEGLTLLVIRRTPEGWIIVQDASM